MTNRWPSCARVSPLATTTNVFLRGLSATVTCKAHSDESEETVTMTEGPPGENGNGHASEATATYWGRCPTCDRLFIVVGSTNPSEPRVLPVEEEP